MSDQRDVPSSDPYGPRGPDGPHDTGGRSGPGAPQDGGPYGPGQDQWSQPASGPYGQQPPPPGQNQPGPGQYGQGPYGQGHPGQGQYGQAQPGQGGYPQGSYAPQGQYGAYGGPGQGAPGGKGGGSKVGLIIGLVLGVLILLGLLGWLLMSLFGKDDPAPAPAPTQSAQGGSSSGEPTVSASEDLSNQGGVSADEGGPALTPGPDGVAHVKVPTSGSLFSGSGELTETTFDEDSSQMVEVAERGEPYLVVWTNDSGKDGGLLHVAGYDKEGGTLSESLSNVAPGKSGMQLLNVEANHTQSNVLYAQGTEGVKWRIEGYPLTSIPTLEPGAKISGHGPAVLRSKKGEAGTYQLEDKGKDGVPVIKVYDSGNLDSPLEHEYGTAPVKLKVKVSSGEQIIVVESDGDWTLNPVS